MQAQHSINTLHQSSQFDSDQSDEQQINKMAWKEPKRLYYPKTTASNPNIEEKLVFQNKYNANKIYEQNIDGMSEYNILTNLLVAEFTSQLKGWRDHALNKTQQEEILKAIKKYDQAIKKMIKEEKSKM
ncbi:hypothetical protein Gotur_014918 [Gossypium turneri]